MSIDSTPIGTVAARVMDDAEDMLTNDPDFNGATNAHIASVLVVAEISWTDIDGDHNSTVTCRATDDRNVLAAGLVERARAAITGQ